MSKLDAAYIQKVFTTLADNPTAAQLDFLVEAHANIGYLAADAESLAEMAEADRKNAEATYYLEAKKGEGKVTDKQADAMAEVKAWPKRQAELEAKTKATKLKNLLETVREAIHAVKFLGRYDSPVDNTIRTPTR